MILACPPYPFTHFLISSHLLRTPDNSHFFHFPNRFELSGGVCNTICNWKAGRFVTKQSHTSLATQVSLQATPKPKQPTKRKLRTLKSTLLAIFLIDYSRSEAANQNSFRCLLIARYANFYNRISKKKKRNEIKCIRCLLFFFKAIWNSYDQLYWNVYGSMRLPLLVC